MKLINPTLARWLAPERALLQSLLLLVVRLYWGWEFFLTGKGKLMDLQKPTEFFQSLGIPFAKVSAIVCGTTESVGGILLLIGLASRLISIPLALLLVAAYATADVDALKAMFRDPDKFTGAAEFLFLYAVVLVLLFGPGKISLDWMIRRKIGGATENRPS
jgi:putative oxidoreductase